MAYYIVSGQRANHLERAVVALAPTPAADSAFPVANLYDGRAGVPFRFTSLTTDSEVIADINLVPDPGFEAGVSSWTVSSGAFTQSNTQASTGTYSAKLTHTGAAEVYYDVTCRAGEAMMMSWSVFGGGGAVAGQIALMNRSTGHYLNWADATWGAKVLLYSRTTGTWGSESVQFTVEPLSTCLRELVTLRIILSLSASGTVYFDDVELYPAVNWTSVHGHNLDAAFTPSLQRSSGGAYASAIALTQKRDSFYGTCATAYYRYWKLLLTGTPLDIPWIGEWVLGQYASLTVNPLYPGALEVAERETRVTMANGAEWVYLRGGAPQRRLTMQFAFRTDAQYQQWKDTITRGSRGGAYPVVIAPTEMDSSVVILGRLSEGATYSKTDAWSRLAEFELVEDPLPMME